jgi:ABC-type sugar transport system ATPase subunit
MREGKTILEMKKITKSFPGVRALKEVNLTLRAGEVHCLVGENGAGKSTLIKIMTGAHTMTSGEMLVNGTPRVLNSPQDGRELGIRAIYQELDLLPTLSVAENIFIEDVPKTKLGLVDWHTMNRKAAELLQMFNVEISPYSLIKDLTVSEQQIVAIVKALSQDSKVLIMDEPSAVLTGSELERLFGIIAELKKQGVAIVYITHRLIEVFEIGDVVTVLRDGENIVTRDIEDVTMEQMIQWMVGREIDEQFYKEEVEIGDVVLEAKNLSVQGLVKDVSFQLREGEILGLAGLVGAGRTELLKSIFGEYQLDGGTLTIFGEECRFKSPRDAIAKGLGFVPEDRKNEGAVLCRSIEENISLGTLAKKEFKFLVHFPTIFRKAVELANYVKIRCHSLRQEVVTLSGGNQQKTVLAKWLASESQILLLDEPTRGIDVGSKLEFYKFMAELVRNNKSIILVSSELPELMALSDRILVMSNSRIRKEFMAGEATQEQILEHAIPQELREAAAAS